jgi:hypothetical protein
MALNEMLLYELLTPFFLTGFRFTEEADSFLRFLAIDELHMSSDNAAVVYVGKVKFVEVGGQTSSRSFSPPGGSLIEWDDFTLTFRLTVPRDGAAFINTTLTSAAAANVNLSQLNSLFNDLGSIEGTAGAPTEYPGVRFRLELLLSLMSFNLGDDWLPGKVDPGTRRVVPDPDASSHRVKFVLPKMVLEYEQGDDLNLPPAFRMKSWGSTGFDSPADIEAGEVIRMEPPLAVHSSGRFAFGVDQILIDLSEDSTPPEILEQFGTDEAFQGLFLKSLRFYYTDEKKEAGFGIAVNDALISFKGEISLEAAVDLFFSRPGISLSVTFFIDGNRLIYFRETLASGESRDTPFFDNADNSVAHIAIDGGYPPFNQVVELRPVDQNGTSTGGVVTPLSETTGRPGEWVITPQPGGALPNGYYLLHIQVTDSAPGTQNTATKDLLIKMDTFPTGSPRPGDDGAPADRPAAAALATITPPAASSVREGYRIVHEGPGGDNTERLRIIGGPARISTGGQDLDVDSNGLVLVPVPSGLTVNVSFEFPAVSGSTSVALPGDILFLVDRPLESGGDLERYITLQPSAVQTSNRSYGFDNRFVQDIQKLLNWIRSEGIAAITLDGFASYEDERNASSDLALSNRRIQAVRAILNREASTVTVTSNPGNGHTAARAEYDANNHRAEFRGQPEDRMVRVTGATSGRPASTTTLSFTRPASTGGKTPVTNPRNPENAQPPTPPAPPDRAPAWMRRLSFRVRFERNIPVLVELSGQIDFDTEMEAYRRRLLDSGQAGIPSETLGTGENSVLELRNRPGASADANPEDGVVDFVINVTYDTSTRLLTETLTLGAVPDDRDGLVQGEYDTSGSVGWSDIVGAILTFAPILNEVGDNIDNEGTEGDIAALALAISVPIALAGFGIFRTKRMTLYGGELKLRQYLPKSGEPAAFTDAGIIFDYGVDFMITLQSIGISWDAPVKVRYKAVGFSLAFNQPDVYQPIFDTSKGYEIDLGDPGRASVPAPLDKILSVLAARIARINPVVFEVAVGMKADLGIITVDRLGIRVTFEDPVKISIQSAGVHVEIPSTISGSGYVELVDTVEGSQVQKGFAGAIDITIIPTKLRVAASLAVIAVDDTTTHRSAVAVYFGLTVEFPAPIVLGNTGVGIYGFTGLFAMHFKRLENAHVPGEAVSPALDWLMKAKGEPANLFVDGVRIWGAQIDRWSFGIGIILGTVEGGFLINFRGMFVLELPGPRILIFVKIQIVKVLPEMKPTTNLNVGILGVIDLDFNLGQITIGVIVDLEIKDIIQVRIPIEIFFSLLDPSNWHLFIGTINQPISAMILNIVRGTGYFMVAGNGILNFRLSDGTPRPLPGLAVAVGLGASVVFGDEDIGLYLKVAARADMGVSFLPEKMFIVGSIQLSGELRLFIVSVGADGNLIVEASETNAYIYGSICGHVDFFFFSVEGCVEVNIGTQDTSFPAPDLVKKVYLQSFAPVIVAGQAGDRPIDGSLGDAHTVLERRANGTRRVQTQQGEIELAANGTSAVSDHSKILTVPIDSVIVAQFGVVPLINQGSATSFFTTSPGTPPSTLGGWVSLGNDRFVRYMLREVSLSPVLTATGGTPPSVWRREFFPAPPQPPSSPPAQGADTQINLALMSRVPVTGARALERSTELASQVVGQWSRVCTPVAPPVCVLWSFCEQPFGPSGTGWHLNNGVPEPDPPGTHRNTPPPTHLYVEEPTRSGTDNLVNILMQENGQAYDIPAQIVGYNPPPPEPRDVVCVDFSNRPDQQFPNPYDEQEVSITVFDFAGSPVPNIRTANFGAVGMDIGFQVEIDVPLTGYVALTLVTGGSGYQIEVFDSDGILLTTTRNQDRGPESFEFDFPRISRLVLTTQNDETAMVSICYALGRQTAKPDKTCIDFGRISVREVRNPYRQDGAIFLRSLRSGDIPESNTIAELGNRRGLVTGEAMEIRIPVSREVELTMALAERFVIRAFDIDENVIDSIDATPGAQFRTFRFSGARISKVILVGRSSQRTALLFSLCFTPEKKTGGKEQPGQPAGDTTCMRALQLPAIRKPAGGNTGIGEGFDEIAKQRLGERWITFHTGGVSNARFLLAVAQALVEILLVAELDGSGNLIQETVLSRLNITSINSITDLPGSWSDPGRPWRNKIEPVLALFNLPEYAGLEVLLFEIKPDEAARQIQLRIPQHKTAGDVPGVLVGVVELCTKEEQDRAEYEEEIKQNEIRTIQDYLNGGDIVPLLEKNRDYVLTIRYDAQVKEGNNEQPFESKTQEFYFRTDDSAPDRLDSYVLGQVPDDEEPFHFYRDPLKLVFNDLSVIQMYDAYGWRLRTVVRSADGNPVNYRDPDTGTPTTDSYSDITELTSVAGEYHSPYRDTLVNAIETDERLACIPGAGGISDSFHGEYIVPVDLRPYLSYTLDVELVDKLTGNPAPTTAAPGEPTTPLYRRWFKTSRYAGMVELGAAMNTRRVSHRALKAAINLIGEAEPAMSCEVVTDQQIQDALVAAGEQALPAAADVGFTIYWAKRTGETHYSPHAILLDAPEPLWRYRSEPVLQKVPNQSDPNFKMVVPDQTPELRVQLTSGSARFIRSTGGTRTLVILSNSYSGGTLEFKLFRDASSLFQVAAATAPLLTIQLGMTAPWEEDPDD